MTPKPANIFSLKTVILLIAAVFFVLADRFFEALCLNGWLDQPIPIIGDLFSLRYVKNYYIAFSIPFSGPILTGIIGLIIVILLIYWLKPFLSTHKDSPAVKLNYPLTILIIGAILNFTDRVKYGFVIDYFYLKYFTVFNLADIIIVVGVFFLIINSKNYEKH
jgi:signal peptidase II